MLPSSQVTFFNFLASHDGIGVTPARGILSEAEIDGLVEQVRTHGGLVSARNMPDGSQVPYELNISYFDALSDPQSDEPLNVQIDRFITAHAIMLCPGWDARHLFPQPVRLAQLEAGGGSSRAQPHDQPAETGPQGIGKRAVFSNLPAGGSFSPDEDLAPGTRLHHQAFSPYAAQRILDLSPAVFCIFRGDPDGSQVVCLHNVSGSSQVLTLDLASLGAWGASDLLSGQSLAGEKLSLGIASVRDVVVGFNQERSNRSWTLSARLAG